MSRTGSRWLDMVRTLSLQHKEGSFRSCSKCSAWLNNVSLQYCTSVWFFMPCTMLLYCLLISIRSRCSRTPFGLSHSKSASICFTKSINSVFTSFYQKPHTITLKIYLFWTRIIHPPTFATINFAASLATLLFNFMQTMLQPFALFIESLLLHQFKEKLRSLATASSQLGGLAMEQQTNISVTRILYIHSASSVWSSSADIVKVEISIVESVTSKRSYSKGHVPSHILFDFSFLCTLYELVNGFNVFRPWESPWQSSYLFLLGFFVIFQLFTLFSLCFGLLITNLGLFTFFSIIFHS